MKVDDRWATEASSQFSVYVAVKKVEQLAPQAAANEVTVAAGGTENGTDSQAAATVTGSQIQEHVDSSASTEVVEASATEANEEDGKKSKDAKKQGHHPIMKRSKRGQRAGGKGAKAC